VALQTITRELENVGAPFAYLTAPALSCARAPRKMPTSA
jgi:hypothetical protein